MLLTIEEYSHYVMIFLTILASLLIFIRFDKKSGVLLAYSFIIMGVHSLVLTHTEVVQFDFSSGQGVFIAPIWYQALMAARALVAIALPLGLYILASRKPINLSNTNI